MPTLTWLFAILTKIAPGNIFSLTTFSPVVIAARLLVVGILIEFIYSEIINSLNTGPRVALPSPDLEKGVFPDPLR